MVNPRLWTFLWIINVAVVIFLLPQFVDSKKHQILHSQQQQQHHRHRQHHRKPHPKFHRNHHHHQHHPPPPPTQNISRSISKKSNFSHDPLDIKKFPVTINLFLNETSTIPTANNNFSNKEEIKSSEFTTMVDTIIRMNFHNVTLKSEPRRIINVSSNEEINFSEFTNHRSTTVGINFNNLTLPTGQIFNHSNVSFILDKSKDPTVSGSISKDSSTIVTIADIHETTSSNFSSNGYKIANNYSQYSDPNPRITGVFDSIRESTNRVITESVSIVIESNDESSSNNVNRTTSATRSVNLDNSANITDRLFTSTEANSGAYDRHEQPVKELVKLFGQDEPRDFIETMKPFVPALREKIIAENGAEDEPKKRTLLDFHGPAISNDPEDSEDPSSSNNVHKRVKRDRFSLNLDDDRLDVDSNYLQDLEDSFAPSALEIRAENSPDESAIGARRSDGNFDASTNKLRIKRDAEDEKYEINGAADSSVDNERVPANNEWQFHRIDASTGSTGSSREYSFVKDESTTLRNVIVELENSRDNSSSMNFYGASTMNGSEQNVKRERENDDDVTTRKRKLASEDSYLRDENGNARNRLDDVYPDFIDDPQHDPSSMIQHVRTKRFGDGLAYPESSDLSYANEEQRHDMSLRAIEPYADDNRIIDSMLNKVNYENVNERERYARRENYDDTYYGKLDKAESPEIVTRDKRNSMLTRRLRKDTDDEVEEKHRKKQKGKSKKKKKKKKRKKKKKHRKKTKNPKTRRTSLLEEREFDAGNNDIKRDSADDDADTAYGFNEIHEPDVASSRDSRNRRDYEDNENYDNFHFDTGESSVERSRRDIRESAQDSRKMADANYANDDVARCADERDRETISIDDTRIREKRENPNREFKYYENVREFNEGPNGTSNITDKDLLGEKASEPIRDIKELVRELLVKVNELHVYKNNGTGDAERTKDSRDYGTTAGASMTFRSTEKSPEIVQRPQQDIGDKSRSKPINATAESSNVDTDLGKILKHRESCWKSAPSNRRLQRSRSARPAKKIGACEKKVRRKRKSHRKWDRWTDWSGCSVTCGRGRQIRWRHCVRNCSTAETEMEEKACQLPACAPGKFLGIFGR